MLGKEDFLGDRIVELGFDEWRGVGGGMGGKRSIPGRSPEGKTSLHFGIASA